MSNTSLSALAVAHGPQTIAPPSFNGNGALVVVNLAVFTAGFFIFLSIAIKIASDLWRRRADDMAGHPVTIWRTIGLLITGAGVLRFGAGAAVMWGWNPESPWLTGLILNLQRFFDPVAALMGLCAMAMFVLSERGMVEQLRKEPFPLNMWASLPQLKKPAIIVALSLVCAIGVVSTR